MIILNAWLFIQLISDEKPEQNPRNLVIEKLGFDAQQTADYDALVIEHKQQVARHQAEIKKMRLEMEQLMVQGDRTTAYGRAESIGTSQRDIELLNFKLCLAIEGLCTDNQKVEFEQLLQTVPDLCARH